MVDGATVTHLRECKCYGSSWKDGGRCDYIDSLAVSEIHSRKSHPGLVFMHCGICLSLHILVSIPESGPTQAKFSMEVSPQRSCQIHMDVGLKPLTAVLSRRSRSGLRQSQGLYHLERILSSHIFENPSD